MAEGRRVLVVDDEQMVLDVLIALLEDDGYAVRTARDGWEALAMMRDWRPDLIVLDLMMPDMDGAAFRDEQRRLDGADAAPVIVLSAAPGAAAQANRLGAAAVFGKPFELAAILDAVARAMRRPE
jgi:CheY-like chemotaxis protein